MTTTATAAQPDVTALGQPLTLRNGTVVPNRIAKAALSECLSSPGFAPGDEIKALYRRWAGNGQCMTITGNVMVDGRYIGEPGNVVVEDERHLADLVEWASIVKTDGSVGIVQINHPGRQTPRSLVAKDANTGSATPARNPRRLSGSAASVVSALAMIPASTTSVSAAISIGTRGKTSAPPTPHAIARRVTVTRTPERTDRSFSVPRAAT